MDWDIHFGNGTMKTFLSDPRVLYISIHRYQNGKFFPCSEKGSHKVVGLDDGEGFTINIPWNKVNTSYLIASILMLKHLCVIINNVFLNFLDWHGRC